MAGWVDPLADDEVPDPLYAALVAAGDGDDVDVVATLLARPEWHQRAACRGMGTEAFFPGRGQSAAPGKAVCSSCPVTAECAEAGLTERHGTWAGRSERERRPIRSQSAPAA